MQIDFKTPSDNVPFKADHGLERRWPKGLGNQQYRAPLEQRWMLQEGETFMPLIDNEPMQEYIHLISVGETLAGDSTSAQKSYTH